MNRLSQAAVKKRLEDENIEQRLQSMTEDDSLATTTSYSTNVGLYPDNEIPFVDKHMAYLLNHPRVNVDHYLANLRLMLKKRS